MIHVLVIYRSLAEKSEGEVHGTQNIDPGLKFTHFTASSPESIRELAGMSFSAVVGMENLQNQYDRTFVQLRIRKHS